MGNDSRIFLSHTTRDNRDRNLAHKLAADLKARGASVWIAPDSIPVGEAWEEYIVTGILEQCSHFLVILSAASITAKWVLEEIRLARRRHEHYPDLKILPLVVGNIGSYPNHDFLEKFQVVPYHDDLHAQLEVVARALRVHPTVPQATSAIVAEKAADFVGREFVFKSLNRFLKEEPKGYFTIEGDPGIGKSAILAIFTLRTGCIAHFNVRAQGVNTAQRFLESVCGQLIARFGLPYPSLPPDATRDGAFMVRLLQEAADRLSNDEQLVIAIDALDEVDLTEQTTNILYLPATLPDRVYFVLTRRKVPLPFTVHTPQVLFNLMKYAEEGQRDAQDYIRQHVVARPALRTWIEEKRLDIDSFAVTLGGKSHGNFMYLRYVLPDLEKGIYSDLHIASLPLGLEGYYEDHWRRMGMTTKPLPRLKIKIVYVLTVTQSPISRTLLAQFVSDKNTTVEELTVQEVLDEWHQFLRQQDEHGTTLYSVYHASFRDFLHRKDIVQAAGISVEGVHGLIAANLLGDLFGNDGPL